jgi:hypothetical protein
MKLVKFAGKFISTNFINYLEDYESKETVGDEGYEVYTGKINYRIYVEYFPLGSEEYRVMRETFDTKAECDQRLKELLAEINGQKVPL